MIKSYKQIKNLFLYIGKDYYTKRKFSLPQTYYNKTNTNIL